MDSLRTCTRNQGLIKGSCLHDGLMQRGLFEKCLHALVIIYGKRDKHGRVVELLNLQKGILPNKWGMGCIMKATPTIGAVYKGKIRPP